MRFEYEIKSVPSLCVLEKGTINALTVFRAALKLERKFKKDVLQRGIKLAVSIFRKGEGVYNQKYERDSSCFRRSKLAEFTRRVLKTQNGRGSNPRYHFVALGSDGELVLTKLTSNLLQPPAWLTRRRKRLLGPFESEFDARRFMDVVEEVRNTKNKLNLIIGRDYGRRRKEIKLYPRNDKR